MVPRRMNTLTRYTSNVSLINDHVLWRLMVPTASRAGGTRCLRTRCGGTCRLRQARYTCGDAATNRQSDLWLHITINGSQSCEPPNTSSGGSSQASRGYRRSPAQFGRRGDWARTVVHCLPSRAARREARKRPHSRRPYHPFGGPKHEESKKPLGLRAEGQQEKGRRYARHHP
ncbi:hypothetical protein FHS76_001351 [Ochrobactrum daejeonense]|uniref:Uncharacterized protein n=1 Tax=Brucella daejeonensis TaxID=659015 RepID=A0A7W9AVR6_9HYPH|nr:hypothetical protein [Brucella daejeonensis]